MQSLEDVDGNDAAAAETEDEEDEVDFCIMTPQQAFGVLVSCSGCRR